MLCRRTKVFPIERVIRGYISGSAWKEWNRTLVGENLPTGSRAARPTIFSPATKAETGHDQNVTVARMHNIVGAAVTAEPERLTRAS